MIIEVGGGNRGFQEYLETGQKKGRELHRDQLDKRIALFGDLDVFELATSSQPGTGRKYDHITLSFAENYISDELLQTAVLEFRDHALSAWSEEERPRIAFYAEAHRPKILSYTNSETGEKVDRLVHIHVGMGRHDLITGKAIEPLGYLGEEADNLKYIDAWQESFNARHGLSSPKDNPKITPENAVDVLARYTGQKPDELGTFNEKKAALEITLQKEILARDITTWAGFEKLLAEHGEVTKMHEGRFDECYRIKPAGSGRAMRLKGVFFGRQFIERSTAEKLAVVQSKARAAYLEQMQPRKEPAYVAAVLNEWHTFKAREHRYLHTGSPLYKNQYLPADAATRLQILNNLEREHHAKSGSINAQGRKTPAARSRLPRLPSRNLDGILKRSEMLLRRNDVFHVPDGAEEGRHPVELRQADGTTERRPGDNSADTSPGVDLTNSRADGGGANSSRDGLRPNEQSAGGESGRKPATFPQPGSVVDFVRAELLDRYQQAADKERYAEIRKHLDCTQLLAKLSHSHGLNPELYQVASAKDGTPRIRCGSRALTPSDFLMRELGMQWKEAAPILRGVYEQQIGHRAVKARTGRAGAGQLWKDFKASQLPVKDELTKQLKVFDQAAKTRRSSFNERLKEKQKTILKGLSGDARQAAHSLFKLEAATAKAEFNAMLKEERQLLRESIQPRNAWQQYLQKLAEQGSDDALIALRKLDDSARAKPEQGVVGTIIILEDEDEKKRLRRAREASAQYLKSFQHTVGLNGDVLYFVRGQAVLLDEGWHLAVLDENNSDAIAAALLIGKEKFGSELSLTGSASFKERCVAVAVEQDIFVTFSDPHLEDLRKCMVAEKHQPTRAPVKSQETAAPATQPTNQPIPAAAPAPQPNAVQQPQPEAEQPATAPSLSAAGWIAQQDKPQAQPIRASDGRIQYVVAHLDLAGDQIVLDQGRAVAVYPLPEGVELHAGDRVIIQKDGSLAHAGRSDPERSKEHGR